ncbi:tetratricopeptide repeat protein [Acidicapsa acidisoli]|uniref:tetratricopeptide repeat protein n=1 Tax=Acidicapsa acidisoli TaxID=1615681 RepID=UPI0021DFA2C3|nr:tetratricopeptide repeat protein [Acidicapsa acidisoli]
MKCNVIVCAASLLLFAQLSSAQQNAATKQKAAVPPAEVQKALALEARGEYSDAQAAWEIVVKDQPRNGQAYAHLGLLEARQEHYPEAIAFYRKAQALDPVIPQLNLDLGLALFKSGSFRESAKLFEAELRKHPKSPETQKLTTLAAMSHYGAREYFAAVPYFKEAAAADPRNLSILLPLAHCLLWTKQLDATMEVFKEILTIDPDSAEADMIAGEALDEKGDEDGAVQQFRAAVQANPKEPNAHFGLAYLLWTQKKFDEAIPEFKAELANDPNNNQAMIYLGDTYVRQDQFDPGKVILEKAARYPTPDPLIHLDLGIVYAETGDNAAAIREFNKTVELEPDNVTAHFRLATLYRSIGKKDEAKAEFVKANSLNKKKDDSVHQRIAAANARLGPDASPAQTPPDVNVKPDQN